MTPERWKQVSQMYDAARSRSPSTRAAYLADACGGDEALRREVEALLDQLTSPTELAGVTPELLAQAIAGATTMNLIGRRFGASVVQELIGAGGMGQVYRARDTKLERDVAIKVLASAFASDADRLARFEREARVLAALDHPNIAAIYGVEESELSPSSGAAGEGPGAGLDRGGDAGRADRARAAPGWRGGRVCPPDRERPGGGA